MKEYGDAWCVLDFNTFTGGTQTERNKEINGLKKYRKILHGKSRIIQNISNGFYNLFSD